MKLIGINGFKTSGKDTAYGLIKQYVEGPLYADPSDRVERRAFADKIKIMGAMCFGFERPEDELIALMDSFKDSSTISMLYQEPNQPKPYDPFEDTATMHSLTGRQFLQNFGQHARTVFGDSFWVDKVLPLDRAEYEKIWRTIGRSGAITGLPAVGCVTDVRYPNEALRILELGGTVLEIIRPGCATDGHSSEKPLPRDLVTHTVLNSDTLRYFDGALREVLDQL